MQRMIRCECGYVARGATDEAVVSQIEAHLRSDHPELARTVSREDILGWIEVVA